jgi:N-dimethylarginine dimethylaminohydrolase
MKPSVLMTHPRHFAIRGGANPHTRTGKDELKEVDSRVALDQWNAYVDALLKAGLDVYVADATPELTGMVFTANAGFLLGRLKDRPSPQKTFIPGHFTVEHRMGETPRFARFMENFGIRVSDYPEQWSWEGEADAFPIGRGEETVWVFTHGFRSDPEVGEWLSSVLETDVVPLKLKDPRYYHGDTALCDLGGPCMAYLDAFDAKSQKKLKKVFKDRLVEIEEKDAVKFLGNSFYVEVGEERFLFCPDGVRKMTQKAIARLGIQVIPVDVSEFVGKAGGGPKCMVFNLGVCDRAEAGLTEEQSAFRHARHIESIRRRRGLQG